MGLQPFLAVILDVPELQTAFHQHDSEIHMRLVNKGSFAAHTLPALALQVASRLVVLGVSTMIDITQLSMTVSVSQTASLGIDKHVGLTFPFD
jgi:hypothetical protein